MIDLYYWPTPNGWKISIMLEECRLPYRLIPVNIARGEQFEDAFLAVSPNNRIPAIVDHDPLGGGAPVPVFESGAILVYLADKSGRLLPGDLRGRTTVLQWLFWQVSGLGPMAGQHGHFRLYAEEKIPYAIERYERETRRLYRVLDRRLTETGEYLAGEYSIADIACLPWIMTHRRQGIELAEFPQLERWYLEMRERPAVRRGIALGKQLQLKSFDAEARRNLFEGP